MRTPFVTLVHWTHGDMKIFEVLWYLSYGDISCKVVRSRKTVKWAEYTICDTCALNSRRYEIFEDLAYTVVKSRKTVKWAEYTIYDTCALNSRDMRFFKVFFHTVVISRKKRSNEHENTIGDTLCTEVTD